MPATIVVKNYNQTAINFVEGLEWQVRDGIAIFPEIEKLGEGRGDNAPSLGMERDQTLAIGVS